MAKKQSRRTVSLGRGIGGRLAAFCESQGIQASALVEYLLANPGARPRDLDAFYAWNDERLERLNRERGALSSRLAGR